MKITYINKDFISEGFIKTVDKMKDSLGKKYTADDIRKEAKKILVEEILKDREFLSKCETCFKHYIHRNEAASSPVSTFRYASLNDGILNVICDVHYSKINIYDDNVFWIDDTRIARYSAEELNNKIDDYCTKRMLQYFKKNHSDLLKYVERIHIEKINLHPVSGLNSNDAGVSEKLILRLSSEFKSKKILNEAEFNELLDKVNALFSFYAKTVLIDKAVIAVNEHKDKLVKDTSVLLDGNNYTKQQKNIPSDWLSSNITTEFDNLTLTGLTRKDLHEFTIDVDSKVIDLHKYLINNIIEESITDEKSSLFLGVPNVNIITTADYSEIEQIKCQLPRYILNIFNNSLYIETEGKYLPKPKLGVIEYLLVARNKTWVSTTEPYTASRYITSVDYVGGKYHNYYHTLLRK